MNPLLGEGFSVWCKASRRPPDNGGCYKRVSQDLNENRRLQPAGTKSTGAISCPTSCGPRGPYHIIV